MPPNYDCGSLALLINVARPISSVDGIMSPPPNESPIILPSIKQLEKAPVRSTVLRESDIAFRKVEITPPARKSDKAVNTVALPYAIRRVLSSPEVSISRAIATKTLVNCHRTRKNPRMAASVAVNSWKSLPLFDAICVYMDVLMKVAITRSMSGGKYQISPGITAPRSSIT